MRMLFFWPLVVFHLSGLLKTIIAGVLTLSVDALPLSSWTPKKSSQEYSTIFAKRRILRYFECN